MTIKENDVIKFDNGSYLVLDLINYKKNMYAFLINNDKFTNDVSIVKVIKKDNYLDFLYIEDDKEFEYVLCKLYLDYKREILSFFD